MIETKIFPKDKEDIFEMYFEKGMKMREIAEVYGVSTNRISEILNHNKTFQKYEKKLTARKNRLKVRADIAALRLMEESTMAAEQVIRIAGQDVASTPIQYQYVIQNASTAILDRAGVKPKEEESKEVHVYLEGGEIDLGTPDDK